MKLTEPTKVKANDIDIFSAIEPSNIEPIAAEPQLSWLILIILPLYSSFTFDWTIVAPMVLNITFEKDIIPNKIYMFDTPKSKPIKNRQIEDIIPKVK